MKLKDWMYAVCLGTCFVLAIGCAEKEAATEPAGESTESTTGSSAESATIDPEVAKSLEALSEEDRTLALKQKVCPVSEEPLGSMGTPVKLDFEEGSVFICCEGCESKVKSDPKKYITKAEQEK